MPCCYADPIIEMPVTIGTNPLEDRASEQIPSGFPQNIQSNGNASSAISNTSDIVITQQPTSHQNSHSTQYGSTTTSTLTATTSHPLANFEGKTILELLKIVNIVLTINYYYFNFRRSTNLRGSDAIMRRIW